MSYRGENQNANTVQTWNGSEWVEFPALRFENVSPTETRIGPVLDGASISFDAGTRGANSFAGLKANPSVGTASGNVQVTTSASGTVGTAELSVSSGGTPTLGPNGESIRISVSSSGPCGKIRSLTNSGGGGGGFEFVAGSGGTTGGVLFDLSGNTGVGNFEIKHNGSAVGPGKTLQTTAGTTAMGSAGMIEAIGYGA